MRESPAGTKTPGATRSGGMISSTSLPTLPSPAEKPIEVRLKLVPRSVGVLGRVRQCLESDAGEVRGNQNARCDALRRNDLEREFGHESRARAFGHPRRLTSQDLVEDGTER